MTRSATADLAARVKREANRSVKIKTGTTNGQGVVHVATKDHPKVSVTLHSLGEWMAHDLNKLNVPARPAKKKGSRKDEADQATVEQGLSTVYSPEES